LNIGSIIEGVAFGAPGVGPVTVYTTADGGSTWTKVQAANLPTPLTDEGMWIYSGNGSYSAVGDAIWFGTSKGRTYHSTDKGATWTAIMVDATRTINSMAFKDAQNGVAVSCASQVGGYATNKVYRTADGGATWTEVQGVPNGITVPRTGMVSHLPGTASTYIAVHAYFPSNSGTLISQDDGLTWSVLSTERIMAAEFLSPTEGWGSGYAIGDTTGIFKWNGSALGIANNATEENDLKVFPNPTSNCLQVNAPLGTAYRLIDLTGKVVLEGHLEQQNISVNDLASGVYLLRVGTKTRRIVVR